MENKLKNKLGKLFEFLKENRKFNKEFHERSYKQILSPYPDKRERIMSLLYHIANTQSQPKIDKLAEFYKKILKDENSLNSFTDFVKKVNSKSDKINFKNLYEGMLSQDGWGPKTSALFVKSIFHLHSGRFSNDLRIWDDVPRTIIEGDTLYLPVDSVIIEVFHKLDGANWSFKKVNDELQKEEYGYSGDKIEIWDDLWFWGFISQKGGETNRESNCFNENKYWALRETDKNEENIELIKTKLKEEYLKIFE